MATTRPLTLLELALLGLIRLAPRSGYDLRKQFATTPLGHFSGSPGAVYPALKRLASRGLIGADVDSSRPLRPREVFRLTPEGRAALRSWVKRLPTRDEAIYSVSELMLRFAFMAGHCTPAHSKKFLEILAAESDAYAAELDAVAKQIADDRAPHGSLAVEHGAEECRTRARWARRAAKRFR